MNEDIQFGDIKNKDSYIQTINIAGTSAQTAGNFGYILTARQSAIEILGVSEKHEVAGNDAGTVVLDVVKVPNGTAISAGSSILLSTFNLKSTANTNVYKEGKDLLTTRKIRYLQMGESLALKTTGTLTNLTGVCVTIYYKFVNNGSYK